MSPNQEKPALLIAATTFPRWKDDPGPAPFVFHHARAMQEHFRVTVLAPHFPGAATQEEMEGVLVKRFVYARPHRLELLTDGAGIRNNMNRGILHRLLAAPLVAAEYLALRSEISRGRYSFLNSHWLAPSGLLAAMAWPGPGGHVITAHAADYDLLRTLPGGRSAVRYMARRAAAIVCVSPRLARGVSDMAGPGARVITLPMGVDLGMFAFSAEARSRERERLGLGDGRVVMFAGKLSPKKGVEVLLRAMAVINRDGEKARLVVVGQGELGHPLMSLARDLGIERSVVFAGAVPNRDLAGLYSAADLVAVPSVVDPRGETEGMPVVILEALAAGRPVVATTPCSPPQELVGKGVIEVEPGDPEALAHAIERALAGEQQVDLSALQEFGVKRTAQRYARILMGEGS